MRTGTRKHGDAVDEDIQERKDSSSSSKIKKKFRGDRNPTVS